MHDYIQKIKFYFYQPRTQILLRFLTVISFMCLSGHAFADDPGSDLLAGTDKSFWNTFNHTGKYYLYGAEGVMALAAYIKTKNMLALVGIIVVAIFINIVLKMAGQSS